jgi:hypothetical protein
MSKAFRPKRSQYGKVLVDNKMIFSSKSDRKAALLLV